jgi:hypothetical protein
MTRPRATRLTNVLASCALAAYALFGLVGYGLHGLLPCSDSSCSLHHEAHDQSDGCPTWGDSPSSDELSLRSGRPGHDVGECALCKVLAQIGVGYSMVAAHDAHAEPSRPLELALDARLPGDLALALSARGPPRA